MSPARWHAAPSPTSAGLSIPRFARTRNKPVVGRHPPPDLPPANGAGNTYTTTNVYKTMKPKSLAAVGIVLLLAGVAVFLKSRSDNSGSPATGPAAADRSAGASSKSSFVPDRDSSEAATRKRRQRVASDEALVEAYGESRTKLSKQVSNNIASVLEDAIEMGEMAATSDIRGRFGSLNGMNMALGKLGGELKLTEEQQNEGALIYQEFQKQNLAKSRQAVARVRDNPNALMHLILASDEFSRGNLPEEEFKALQTESGEELEGLINPLDRENFRGGKPLLDAGFRDSFKAILDPAQTESFEKAVAEQDAADEEGQDTANITNLPSMEIEKLDETVNSVKQLTSGLKSVMQGMNGLQELTPPPAPEPDGDSGE